MTDPFAGLNAALAGHYVIDRELGRGGMATVYLARDLKHERFVALKTLRPEIALALGRERFLREIKLAARLQHPNILPVYDSGDAGGTLFYVMPYVEGESLRDRLEREPQLPLEDALQITSDVADALSYAHSHDVVHRDIKPENIMLSGGHAIVTDFGIARAVSAAGGDRLTETGMAIGTPAYMSPEQATASGHVDRRSDIYSLGCVLYETLAGQPPFTGPTAQAIMARHSLDSVPRLRVVRQTIPDALETVINRALAKVPADRYQTAAQFAAAVAAAGTGTVSAVTAARRPTRPGMLPFRWPVVVAATAALLGSAWALFGRGRDGERGEGGGLDAQRVAVLYFEDLSPDSSIGYLADGVTESVIDALTPIRPLDVISRNGVAPFRSTELPRDSIARVLQAGTLVVGSIQPEGAGRVRVTTRLLDGESGDEFARRSFVLAQADPLTIRDSAAQDIASFLRTRLGGELQLRERRLGTASGDAWAFVQRAERARKEARQAGQRDRAAGLSLLAHADTLVTMAERADPAWIDVQILRAWLALETRRYLPDEAARVAQLQRGLAAAERALAMDGSNARAHEIRGIVRYALWQLKAPPSAVSLDDLARLTRQDLEAAVRADPTLAWAHTFLSFLHHDQKDIVSSVLAARNAYEADAYLETAEFILGRLFHSSYNISQFAEARRWCQEGARRFPTNYQFVECELRMLITPDARPDVDLAWRLAARVDSLSRPASREFNRRRAHFLVAAVIAKAGRTDSADAVAVRSRAGHEVDPTQSLVAYEGLVRNFMGQADSAVSLLKRYIAANPDHSFEEGGDLHWWWRNLRDRPDFRALLGTNR